MIDGNLEKSYGNREEINLMQDLFHFLMVCLEMVKLYLLSACVRCPFKYKGGFFFTLLANTRRSLVDS